MVFISFIPAKNDNDVFSIVGVFGKEVANVLFTFTEAPERRQLHNK
jgi:hypothetical protein